MSGMGHAQIQVVDRAAQTGKPPLRDLSCRTSKVLEAVVRRMPGASEAPQEQEPADTLTAEASGHVAALAEALSCSEGLLQQRIGRIMRLHGVSAATIIDVYIPHIARQLGRDWTEDTRSFADVTICSSRLLTAVRELSHGQTADCRGGWDAPSVAIILPEREQHTLGAAIAASQLRRQGVSVQLMMGRTDHEVLDTVNQLDLDMIALSASTSERLETVRKLIKVLRTFARNLPPIVVSGAGCVDEPEVRAYLDADHIINDPIAALHRCGLTDRIPRSTTAPGLT